MRSRAIDLCRIALFTGITCVFSLIAIPLPFSPVPVSLATLAVYLTGAMLGSRRGAIAQTLYVLLGLFGLPVFSGGRAGFEVLAGPSGGYLVGYVLAAWLVGFLIERGGKVGARRCHVAMAAGYFAVSVPGALWMAWVLKMPLPAALLSGIVVYLPGDLLKVLCAAQIAQRVRPVLLRLAHRSST